MNVGRYPNFFLFGLLVVGCLLGSLVCWPFRWLLVNFALLCLYMRAGADASKPLALSTIDRPMS